MVYFSMVALVENSKIAGMTEYPYDKSLLIDRPRLRESLSLGVDLHFCFAVNI